MATFMPSLAKADSCRPVDPRWEVRLSCPASDRGNGDACGLQLSDERDGAVAFGFVLEVVVVVGQLGVGVGFVGVLEGFGDVVVADNFVPEGLAQGAIFVEGFVDDIPALDATFVAADDGADVVAHTGQERVAVEEIAFIVVKDPGGNLAVPDQIVADDEHVVLFAEGDVLVGNGEVVLIRLRMNVLPFKAVFGRDGVELRFNDGIAARILAGNLRGVNGSADEKSPGRPLSVRRGPGPWLQDR